MYKLRTINVSQHMALPEISSNMQQCLIIYPGKKGSNVCEGINISCTYQRWTPALPKPIPAKALARCMLALASRSSGFLMALHNMETMVPVNSHMEMVENQDREGKKVFFTDLEKIFQISWEKNAGNGISLSLQPKSNPDQKIKLLQWRPFPFTLLKLSK